MSNYKARTNRRNEFEKIYDATTKTTYIKKNFLGRGGFAKCFELKNAATGVLYAGKVVPKSLLLKPHHKEKMFQEIHIHSTLSHQYIVGFHSYFEDEENVYIVLELCRKRSLAEMHKRRKTLTISEVRYFVKQIAIACQYIHESKVIHRDLKLGNLFLNDDMEIKVGDFGLATRICFDGERKKTLCGTPNYIAPEILTKAGHSYEVDMWSLGCIMYTLLIGNPPFETSTLKDTYHKIRKNEYYIPSSLETSAKSLIKRLLHPVASSRPTAKEILQHEFLDVAYIPSRLPTSCLSMQPRANHNISVIDISKVSKSLNGNIKHVAPLSDEKLPTNAIEKDDFKSCVIIPDDYYLNDLLKMVKRINAICPVFSGHLQDAQDPSLIPFVWISRWVDYSDKYGIGYQLCDNSIGIAFNDITHILLHSDGYHVDYIDEIARSYYTLSDFPHNLQKKITILNYFNKYMNENLVKAGNGAKQREGGEISQLPHLRAWFRTKSAIIFHLTNGTFQANFFKDHTKIIICPIMGAVSFIDEDKNFDVYSFKLIETFGCPPILAQRLKYAKNVIKKLHIDFNVDTLKENVAPTGV